MWRGEGWFGVVRAGVVTQASLARLVIHWGQVTGDRSQVIGARSQVLAAI